MPCPLVRKTAWIVLYGGSGLTPAQKDITKAHTKNKNKQTNKQDQSTE